MRHTGDFVANLPDAHCSFCKSKPTRAEKGYYTHLATEKIKLTAACSTCANKKDLAAGWTDWSGKVRNEKEKVEREKATSAMLNATGAATGMGHGSSALG